jgi:quercetin 2,3-dioxygenase
MINVRQSDKIFEAHGEIENGTFEGRWHFSFDRYTDPEYERFGVLRVFNDDTLSPGAVWPLHPHKEIEVVTYCAKGEFRHADENGKGGVLKKGWAQHTTVGKGMWHSEINARKDQPMRFIQMWFLPSKRALEPSVEQMSVEKADRTNRFLPLASNKKKKCLKIQSDAEVYSAFLEADKTISHGSDDGRGMYLYVVEGGPVMIGPYAVSELSAAVIKNELGITVQAVNDAEMLLIDVALHV